MFAHFTPSARIFDRVNVTSGPSNSVWWISEQFVSSPTITGESLPPSRAPPVMRTVLAAGQGDPLVEGLRRVDPGRRRFREARAEVVEHVLLDKYLTEGERSTPP